MTRHTGPYVVRQDAFAFFAFIFVGTLFVVSPWLDTLPLWLHLMSVGFGILALCAGVLGWKSAADHPACKYWEVVGERIDGQVEMELGDDYRVPLVIGHDEWDWDPDEFVELVSDCIRDPTSRDALGEFDAPPKHARFPQPQFHDDR